MRQKNQLLAIAGFKGSGKDTIGDYLCSEYNFQKDSFAAPLKDAVSNIFGWDRTLLEGDTVKSREWREQIDSWWAERLGILDLSPRKVLQLVGTEVFRQNFHDKMWLLSLERRFLDTTTNMVVTDARFQNELGLVRDLGGMTIAVLRGDKPDWWEIAEIANGESANASEAIQELKKLGVHPSEYSWIGFPVDHVIENNGTFSELYEAIDTLLMKENTNVGFQQQRLF